MHTVAAGSIATDYLHTYNGVFQDALKPEFLSNISVSFLADTLEIRRGGVAANISYGMSQLGCPSTLLGAVGNDFDSYRNEYEQLAPHADLHHVLVDDSVASARFTCTTDTSGAQIATFFPGAMASAAKTSVAEVHAQENVDVCIISPNDPSAMSMHTQQCRDLGIPFAADPSQQVTFMPGDVLRDLVEGAELLFTNENEATLLAEKTGWSLSEMRSKVSWHITTLGEKGAVMVSPDGTETVVAVTPADNVVDPTGAGDSFRAGFFAGRHLELSHVDAAKLGSVVASFAVEALGPQGYTLSRSGLLSRAGSTFGDSFEATLSEALGTALS